MEIQDDRVLVTLLTGILGTGKTTLLDHLLRDRNAGRIAVIMNEFGEVGLDHDLIEEITKDTILLHAGCQCCSMVSRSAASHNSTPRSRRRNLIR